MSLVRGNKARKLKIEYESSVLQSRDGKNESLLADSSVLQYVALIMLISWGLEHWLGRFAYTWAVLGAAFWITSLHAQRRRHQELEKQRIQLNSYWKQELIRNQPITGKEATEWLSKLLLKLWPNVVEPRLFQKAQRWAERNVASGKPRSIRRIELKDFTLGNAAPEIGLGRTFWSTDQAGQEVLNTGLKWVSHGLQVTLALHRGGLQSSEVADVIISSIQIHGDLRILPILDGQGLLYSFASMPEVNISLALSPESQFLPTDVTGIQLWLENLLSESLHFAIEAPGHHLWTLVPVNLNKTAIGGSLTVTVLSASNLSRLSRDSAATSVGENLGNHNVQRGRQLENMRVVGPTFVEVVFENVQRKTSVATKSGPNPEWGDSLSLVMHDSEGLLQLSVYEQSQDGGVYEFLGSCNIKVKYAEDDSTFYWAVGSGERVIAARSERAGLPVELAVPLQHAPTGIITVRITLGEWLFAHDASGVVPLSKPVNVLEEQFPQLWPPLRTMTGRTLRITVLEGRGLGEAGVASHIKPYVRLEYGKHSMRTKAVGDINPVWQQEFNFAELTGGEELRLSCWNAATWQHHSLGTARINTQVLAEGSPKKLRLQLERVESGEIWISAEIGKRDRSAAVTPSNKEANVSANAEPISSSSRAEGKGHGGESLRLVVLEGRNLKNADRNGELDAYVSLHYGNLKRKTKVVQRSRSPQWNQTFVFPLNSGPLLLRVKDHQSMLTTQSIGQLEIDPHSFAPNETDDRWHAMKETGGGEVRLQVTRVKSETEIKPPPVHTSDASTSMKLQKTSQKLRRLLQEGLSLVEGTEFNDVQRMIEDVAWHEDERESLIAQLQKDRDLLIFKVKQLEQAVADFL